MCFQITKNIEIIQNNLHEHAKILFENHVDNMLVGWWCVFQSKRHD
jgi:hypothetical protein